MNEKELLKKLIDEPKKPNVTEWVYEVEAFLEEIEESNAEACNLIDNIKRYGDTFNRCSNLVALLRQLYKRKYSKVALPPISKRNQIFIAMMFSDETNIFYENAYKLVIQAMNYAVMRIDEKEYAGSIINEIQTEITDSIALIADLTGNRGGVYYEAGIARGLQLCNHPIKIILTCQKDFFDSQKVHFDVSGDNILLYSDVDDLKIKLKSRIEALLSMRR